MKKTKSFFVKIGIFMTIIVLALDVIVLFLSYNITYDNTLEYCQAQLSNAGEIAVGYTENIGLDNKTDVSILSRDYNYICKAFDISYAFAVYVDVEEDSETYLVLGFGEDASQEARETRYPGVVVNGSINEKELEALNGENGSYVFSRESTRFGETLICYTPFTRCFDKKEFKYKEIDQPILIGTEMSLTAFTKSFQERFNLIAILTIVLTLVIVVSFGVILYFKVSRPVRKISSIMSSFVTDREKDKAVEKLPVKGNDEFSLMSNAFNNMTDEIDRYINDIDALTREKHTQEAELNIARRIQMGLLRPGCINNNKIGIDAYMLPAKDVGGDLYEYQLLDDGRVFVAIADVSGKGISAALFMSRAITLLHQFMLTESSPAKILSVYNDTLAEQNPSGLFITTFLAVWDPSTNILTYSNAGHNFPYILSDTLVTLDGAHGVAAGLFVGEEYEDTSVPFSEGDTLYLYTDGVNEAKNIVNAFYTTERLEKMLSESAKNDPSNAMSVILKDLNDFTRDAEQNDDITMLTLYLKPQPAETVLQLSSQTTELKRIKKAIFALNISDDMKKTLALAAEEMFVNICLYAYDTPGAVELKIVRRDNGVDMTFIDSGKPFDPTADLLDIDEYDHENAIGGLGRFLTFTIADRYQYEYRDNQNILYLSFVESDQTD